jgi:hypothetical protein
MGDANAHAAAGSGNDRDLAIQHVHHSTFSRGILTVTAIKAYSATLAMNV